MKILILYDEREKKVTIMQWKMNIGASIIIAAFLKEEMKMQ